MDNMTPTDRKMRASLPMSTIDTARKFLRYSFIELDFQYEQLTEAERSFCTKEEFDRMVEQLRLR